MGRIILYLLLIGCMQSCSPKLNVSYQRTGKVECSSYDRMTITLISEGQAESVNKAIKFAERNAFENLFFKGIPNSNQEKPLIPSDASSKKQNELFLTNFIENREFEIFILSSFIDNDFFSLKIHNVNQLIKIDLLNLRNYLVENGIIKEFGLY